MCKACNNDIAAGMAGSYARDWKESCRQARKAGPPRWLAPVTPVFAMSPRQLDGELAKLARRLPELNGEGGAR